jgi:hypothetical protein
MEIALRMHGMVLRHILKMITKMASLDSFDNLMHDTTLIMENVPSESYD